MIYVHGEPVYPKTWMTMSATDWLPWVTYMWPAGQTLCGSLGETETDQSG